VQLTERGRARILTLTERTRAAHAAYKDSQTQRDGAFLAAVSNGVSYRTLSRLTGLEESTVHTAVVRERARRQRLTEAASA